MAVYDIDGNTLTIIYDIEGDSLSQCYDISGNALMDGGGGDDEEEFVKTTLAYNTTYIITDAWLANAETQRDALITAFNATADGIPFFIQTDGHGRKNEGNKGCHNLAESGMGYIRNMMLGDYGSYYNDGENPSSHTTTSAGIKKYLPVMGNHEFLNTNSENDILADLPTLVDAYTLSGAVLGSETYGFYKLIDTAYNVKYLVMQVYRPDETASNGFISHVGTEQISWLIEELSADDGYDIVIVKHAPFNGTYIRTADSSTATITGVTFTDILIDRKAKASGSFTDSDGVEHSYDFTGCTSELLCGFSGHAHKEMYKPSSDGGFTCYSADWFGRDYTCCYGLIDRTNSKLKIWKFSRSSVADVLEIDL